AGGAGRPRRGGAGRPGGAADPDPGPVARHPGLEPGPARPPERRHRGHTLPPTPPRTAASSTTRPTAARPTPTSPAGSRTRPTGCSGPAWTESGGSPPDTPRPPPGAE